ncbi:MAG: helix-turn-helix transcriptional regulator [Bacteroidetes bacterium]|nr:helix-turn-helix transcriptional regulator [Bacteroidota bacterium]
MPLNPHNVFLKKIALRLKKLREKHNLTQEDVLNDTGIHIGRIESGKRDFSVSTLQKLAEYFQISASELLKGIK